MSTEFSAADSALGYLYQARQALYLLLDNSEETELSIEKLDDVAFEKGGEPRELIQLKHHRTSASLTDASSDLWKTIRVWSTSYQENRFSLPGTLLTLITTGTAPDDSIAALLRSDDKRSPLLAVQKLIEITKNSTSKELKPCFEAFCSLSKSHQDLLVEAIRVIDSHANINDTAGLIKKKIEFSVQTKHLDNLYERLEGWWLQKVISHLSGEASALISRFEVHAKVVDLSRKFVDDDLPVDFLDAAPAIPPAPEIENRLFVIQLREIALNSKRVEKAILDFYKAFAQRSRWAREELIIGDELETYEKRLIDEWERLSLALQDRYASDCSSEEQIQELGRKIYDWMELEADIRLRPKTSEPYVMRGSFHSLANRLRPENKSPTPYVWWHPNFLERLEAILTKLEA